MVMRTWPETRPESIVQDNTNASQSTWHHIQSVRRSLSAATLHVSTPQVIIAVSQSVQVDSLAVNIALKSFDEAKQVQNDRLAIPTSSILEDALPQFDMEWRCHQEREELDAPRVLRRKRLRIYMLYVFIYIYRVFMLQITTTLPDLIHDI